MSAGLREPAMMMRCCLEQRASSTMESATVSFAGLVAPGEFQFNVVVPSSLANGHQPVSAMYNGLTTQAGTLINVHQ